MAGADIRLFSMDRRGLGRNFVLGIVNGALLILADTLIHPTLVLALFVAQLTDDNLLIGLVPAISTGVWFLPQLLSAAFVQGRRRKLPWATGASLVRTAAIGLLAYVGYRADRLSDDQLLRSFFICYVAYNLAAGFANVPSTDVAARAIGNDRRALFFSQRNLWGGILGFVAGLVAREVLGEGGPDFPRNYTLLFFAAAASLLVATYFQAMMKEPQRVAAPAQASLLTELRQGPRIMADANYRRFLLFRVLLSLSAIADPFYVIYAQRELDVPASMIGTYIAALALARIVSNLVWSPLSTWQGNKTVLQLAALLRLLTPLVAVILPYVADLSLYQDHVDNERILFYAFGLVFVAYGAALSGQILSNMNYLLDIAPDDRRPTYIGFANTILGFVAFIPVVGGVVVDRYGFTEVFFAAMLIGLAAVFVSGALTDTHVRARPTAQAWRLRRARL